MQSEMFMASRTNQLALFGAFPYNVSVCGGPYTVLQLQDLSTLVGCRLLTVNLPSTM